MTERDHTDGPPANEQDISSVVLRLFESARQSPGAPHDPDRLLAFLTAPPVPKGRRSADTFAGRRRLVRFMDAVQLEFGICFTNDEWERGFGLADLVEAVEAKLRTPASQKRLADKRVHEARIALTGEPIKFGILAGVLLAAPIVWSSGLVRFVLAGLWVAIVVGTVVVCARHHRYARELAARISHRAG